MMDYPKSNREEIIEDYHGYKISDPYRWLENGDDKKVQEWTSKQNIITADALNTHANPNKYVDELKDISSITIFGMPMKINNKYFWIEKKGNENQNVLYVKDTLNGEPRILINPNIHDKNGSVSLDYWAVSRTGKYVIYGLSQNGDENSSLHIIDSDSGVNLSDAIPNARTPSISWFPDDKGFYYGRYPTPGTVPNGEELYHRRIYSHNLGDDWNNDRLIFGEGRAMEDRHDITLTQDGKNLFVESSADWIKTEVSIVNIDTGEAKSIVKGLNYLFYVSSLNDRIFIRTNYKAENFRIIVSNINSIPESIDEWDNLIPECDNILSKFKVTADKLLAVYSNNLSDTIKIFDHSGRCLNDLPISKFTNIAGISASRFETEFFYSISNFFCGNTTYRFDPHTGNIEEFRKIELSLSEDDFQLSQEWCVSTDGEKIPMFIFHKKDIKYDSSNPTLMYGYGGFGTSMKPMFFSNLVPFLRRGGILVVTNIRGGSEFGEAWHRDGMLDKKINSFNDFISCAEYLIKNKVTNSSKLAIAGGSNGGLLVGTCMILRPELFKAVVCMVPLLDMIRFPKFLMAKRWVSEYGDPDKKEDFEKIIKWSPYHNVKVGIKYPSILFEIANNDTRVDPLHSRKMVALMQYSNKSNTVLLRTESKAGHGPGMSKELMIKQNADTLAFLEWQLQ